MTHATDIEIQAAEWLARRDAAAGEGRAADEGRESPEFTAWLASDPRHRAAYLRLAAAWERSASLKRLRPPDGVVDADLLKPHRPGARSRSWRAPLALAAGLAAIGFAGLWWAHLSGSRQIYRTEIGGLSRVVLKDGSTVTLNTDTELQVRFSPSRREVMLERGEAQFSVTHDAARPFDVLAGGRVVRAVGTAFDIKLDHGESMEVMVTDGRVALLEIARAPGTAAFGMAPPTISAGEAALATSQKVTVRRVSATDVARRLAWEVGELSFQGETLADCVAEFNRYNRKKLLVSDPSIASLQIGGNFQALDVDSFVAALGRSFGIAANTLDDGTVALSQVEGTAREQPR